MRRTVKKSTKKPAKKPAKKKSVVKWVEGDGSKGASSTAITGGRYTVVGQPDGYHEVFLTGQNGALVTAYACKDESTADLIVTLIEEGLLIP
jgi:hypothetical protein